jgi:cyclophilin family peptidyl-prolyl cis-trans isomerase
MSSASAVRYGVGTVAACLVLATAAFAAQPKKTVAKKTGAVPAQKAATPKSKAKSAFPKPEAKSLQEWKALDERRKKLRSDLKDLQSEFTVSSRVRKLEIKQEFERLVDEWKSVVEPKMVKLALAKLTDDPDSELAARLGEDVPDQRQVVAVTERLIKGGKATGPVLRLAGLAYFNLNEFQRSAELLEKARDKNAAPKDPTIIDVARDYVKNWQKEQDLRKKEQAAASMPKTRLPRVLIETGKGNILVELFENEAPNTVANFISLVEKKFYDGQHFYNARPLLSVEAGDPTTKPKYDKKLGYGFGGPGYTIKTEAADDNARLHFRGSLSMVNYGKDTEGSQFAILRVPRPEWNPSAGGLGGQTVFGRVVKGMDVADKLQNGDKLVKMTVLAKRPHAYTPKTSLDKDQPAKKEAKSKSGAAPFPKTGAKPKNSPAKKNSSPPKSGEKPKSTANPKQ